MKPTATSPTPHRRLAPAALDVALSHASGRARALVEGLGMPAPLAARHIARRMALDGLDVLTRLGGVRISPSWRTGCRLRPTRRPARLIEDEDNTEKRGAA